MASSLAARALPSVVRRLASQSRKLACPGARDANADRLVSRCLNCCQRASAPACSSAVARTRARRHRASSSSTHGALSASANSPLSQASQSSARAWGAAAFSVAITRAAAGVVESRQPVSSAIDTPARTSWLRRRRASTRSSTTTASGRWPALRASMTMPAQAWTSASTPSQTLRCGSAVCAFAAASTKAAKGSSPAESASRRSALPGAAASTASVTASAPPMRKAIQAEGVNSNSASVATGAPSSAQATATSSKADSMLATRPTATASRTCIQNPARADGARPAAAVASACAASTTRATS